ncbi:ABC transporter ATP-binding protein [Oceanospirillum linum]|uniref:Iron ABC transporter ATP-binding protein n=1 Tax=Oceanospirillum linum TaxID=966 RepID=A0A1T1HDK1_OCELI|nr:ATP-binding cassette domain-containing protein [Oceanospirillum linum]OOV87797.1 iron ABC transporter ATP-binding protein [Oceanospirillum linum]SEG11979.1 iron complex transport system ATP-binding protein [Oleiphilus messinensis]SMP09386.1 iron complex transport system ATP-binding protein [Oceanospirillum linum]
MISVNKLFKTYGKKTVVSDVGAHFPAHKLTSLIGPNGAGKTSLLMMIARLLEPTHGDIFLNGNSIFNIRPADYAKKVATLRQAPGFNLRLTVSELVAFGRFPYSRGVLTTEDYRVIDEAIEFLSLGTLRDAYLDEISGGQRQMAFLAMTIAQQTDCLLLDEPLNNLDIKHAVQIMSALRRLCDEQGRTVILVVHDLNFAANYSDHIVAMKEGRVHYSGSVENVVKKNCLQDLYELNFRIARSEQGYLCNYFKPSGELK